MWKQSFYTLALILCSCSLYSQPLEKKLEQWDIINPIQKLYLHFDHETYFAGQTIWFKAYFLSYNATSSRNSTLYVELLNNQSEILSRQIFPSMEGQALGQMELPNDLVTGSYQVRAYAPLMLNQPDFLFTRRINVFGKENKTELQQNRSTRAVRDDSIHISLFPEGGNLLTGVDNQVAFKVTDANGYPFNTIAELRNGSGQLIAPLNTVHDGMGIFSLRPIPAESYYVTIPDIDKKYYLPSSLNEGVLFNISTNQEGKKFRIQQVGQNMNYEPAYMIGQMQHQVVFSLSFNGNKRSITGVLQTDKLLSGILQVTVFNKDGIPLAERLTFIDNKEYLLSSELTVDSVTGNNTTHAYTLKLLDSLTGYFSLSVTNADYEPAKRPNNIISHFLLASDIKGYVHNPSWYFLSDADSVTAALDLVMMTNGWSRFKWEELSAGKAAPVMYKDPGYITLNTQINIEGSRKPFADRDVALIMSATDTLVKRQNPLTILHTDNNGRFKLDSLIFFGGASIYVSDIRGKKGKWIKARLEDSLWTPIHLNPLSIPMFSGNAERSNNLVFIDAYKSWEKVNGVMLEPVVVKGRVKSPKQIVEENYVTNPLFQSSIDFQSVDLVNEEPFGADIFAFISHKVPGWRNGQYKFYDSVKYYLNDVELQIDEFKSIPVSSLAFVKVIGNFMRIDICAVAVYTKKGADVNAMAETGSDILYYNGYSVIKEFYDATMDLKPCENSNKNNGFTFQWKPGIFFSSKNPNIPIKFCNNSMSPNIKVVVEGVTDEGKFLMFEKIIKNEPQ